MVQAGVRFPGAREAEGWVGNWSSSPASALHDEGVSVNPDRSSSLDGLEVAPHRRRNRTPKLKHRISDSHGACTCGSAIHWYKRPPGVVCVKSGLLLTGSREAKKLARPAP